MRQSPIPGSRDQDLVSCSRLALLLSLGSLRSLTEELQKGRHGPGQPGIPGFLVPVILEGERSPLSYCVYLSGEKTRAWACWGPGLGVGGHSHVEESGSQKAKEGARDAG